MCGKRGKGIIIIPNGVLACEIEDWLSIVFPLPQLFPLAVVIIAFDVEERRFKAFFVCANLFE